ncbi:hypothetical protein [Shewanella sp. NIFS-20-20]|uniref:hypothetical protein n=1 Tax=Shewanella sp. NIFS-20-20 TaxID=2853806 RepID=UPI001C48D9A3|nr:hypothetical protein [Shewanella sp. NIFS-20-20]MBV7314865.1 hypothetical protein [Shewanella sp. NIFS-20-20]
MAHVSQSASLSSIIAYLKQVNDYDDQSAQNEAKEIMHNLVDMRHKGYITGWYFDEQGHLSLLPSDAILKRITQVK